MRELVVYGLGQLGQLYGAAALRAGMRVTPITRHSDPEAILQTVGRDVPILVAVSEDALDAVLERLGPDRGHAAILLQNELFPSRWQRHGMQPTVLVAWLLKKPDAALTVIRPTPVFGAHAELLLELHRALAIPAVELHEERALHQALVEKYAFILTINTLGLLRDRTMGMWLQEDPRLVHAVALEAAQLGALLCGQRVDLLRCAAVAAEGMRALSGIGARGRTAKARVERALEHGASFGLELPELRRAAAEAQRS
ncbi:MAG: hypothetical protein JWN48_2610 [Myxococcaceae bacterium]|nr:hypothetical protein [Myxococcaceae bacterium]